MARPSTVARVHAAVLDLAQRGDPTALTMEGIAAAADVGKQTLYRTWPSVPAILFDALASEHGESNSVSGPEAAQGASAPDAPEPATAPPHTPATDTAVATIVDVLRETSAEISTEPRATLLRALAAAIQTDEEIARHFHERLLEPQRLQLTQIVARAGYANPAAATELLLAPIAARWLLRLPPLSDSELRDLAERVRALTS